MHERFILLVFPINQGGQNNKSIPIPYGIEHNSSAQIDFPGEEEWWRETSVRNCLQLLLQLPFIIQ